MQLFEKYVDNIEFCKYHLSTAAKRPKKGGKTHSQESLSTKTIETVAMMTIAIIARPTTNNQTTHLNDVVLYSTRITAAQYGQQFICGNKIETWKYATFRFEIVV